MLQGHRSNILQKCAECLLCARTPARGWGNSSEPDRLIAYALAFRLVGKQAMTKQGGVGEEEQDATGTRMGWGRDVT